MRTSSIAPNLPQPIAAYFAADKVDSVAVSRCFTENAIVRDEGHTYTGITEIARWKTEASKKYEYTCQPIACEQEDGRTVVTCTLTGNFPGSPVDLRFFFVLAGEKVASLEVRP
jgi:hypothetical protein